jgi:hypothetical protein
MVEATGTDMNMATTASNVAMNTIEGSSNFPLAPHTASESRATRRTFLESLADDATYQKLVKLLDAAPVSRY